MRIFQARHKSYFSVKFLLTKKLAIRPIPPKINIQAENATPSSIPFCLNNAPNRIPAPTPIARSAILRINWPKLYFLPELKSFASAPFSISASLSLFRVVKKVNMTPKMLEKIISTTKIVSAMSCLFFLLGCRYSGKRLQVCGKNCNFFSGTCIQCENAIPGRPPLYRENPSG